jgi:hypothetical protein
MGKGVDVGGVPQSCGAHGGGGGSANRSQPVVRLSNKLTVSNRNVTCGMWQARRLRQQKQQQKQ